MFEEGANKAGSLKMKYWKAIGHHYIGCSSDIRDTNDTIIMKLRHKDMAMDIFMEQEVMENALVWA